MNPEIDLNKAETIANKGRESIGWYCMNECKALCCQKGKLLLTNNEAKEISNNKVKEYKTAKIMSEKGENQIVLELEPQACPKLTQDNKCGIFQNKNRPKACSDFPLFIYGDKVMKAEFCPAIKTGLLNKTLTELEKAGLIIL